jgi:DNA-binding protein HU-beta
MVKQDLVKSVASKIEGATQKDVAIVIDTVLETIKESVANGEKINLVGFGSFEAVERAAREGRNPKTGESISIPASKAPKFKAGKNFKDMVNA